MQRFDAEKLKGRMLEALQRRAVPRDVAQDVVDALVETSLRGTDSHGINLYPHYCRVASTDRINNDPKVSLIGQRKSAAVLDGDHGFGHYVGRRAMDEAIQLASETGVGAIAVANSSHFAAASYYGLYAARQGFIGLSFTNADSLVKVPGAKGAFFGTNPVCFSAPMEDEEPFCLDMATSQIAWNKIVNHRRVGTAVEEGMAFDAEGQPVTDAHTAASLAPTGDYKGFGLGMMVEILCGLLAGGPAAKELTAMYVELDKKRSISHFMLAMDVTAFQPLDVFQRRLTELATQIRRLPRLDGAAVPPLVPGDPEKIMFAKRSQEGIPVDSEKLRDFLTVDQRFEECLI